MPHPCPSGRGTLNACLPATRAKGGRARTAPSPSGKSPVGLWTSPLRGPARALRGVWTSPWTTLARCPPPRPHSRASRPQAPQDDQQPRIFKKNKPDNPCALKPDSSICCQQIRRQASRDRLGGTANAVSQGLGLGRRECFAEGAGAAGAQVVHHQRDGHGAGDSPQEPSPSPPRSPRCPVGESPIRRVATA